MGYPRRHGAPGLAGTTHRPEVTGKQSWLFRDTAKCAAVRKALRTTSRVDAKATAAPLKVALVTAISREGPWKPRLPLQV